MPDPVSFLLLFTLTFLLVQHHVELQLLFRDEFFDPASLAFLIRGGEPFLQRCDLLQQFHLHRDDARILQHGIRHTHIFRRLEIRGQVDRLAFVFQPDFGTTGRAPQSIYRSS